MLQSSGFTYLPKQILSFQSSNPTKKSYFFRITYRLIEALDFLSPKAKYQNQTYLHLALQD